MLINLLNLTHQSGLHGENYIFYESQVWAWQNDSIAPPTTQNEAFVEGTFNVHV